MFSMTNAYNPGLHRYTVFVAFCTLALLLAGALVTSNDAGLSIPDWPTNYGAVVPPLVGGIRYEFFHRAIAAFVGLLTIILAIRFWREEPRRWVRRLALVALGAVVAQGVLGGLTVLFMQPVLVSAGHATLAQIFFSTVCSLALLTSRGWGRELAQVEDAGTPGVRTLALASAVAIFLQLVLGAVFRHGGFGIMPHLVGAAVVTILVFWTAAALRRRYPSSPELRRCRQLLHALIGLQLVLGGAAWWSRLYAREFPQPIPLMVALTVAHTVFGAVVLAFTVMVTLACYQMLGPRRKAALASRAEHAA
jgi:cytochrome c oxidase assembly protein subunit 15